MRLMLLCLLALVVIGSASAQVTIYESCNYAGRSNRLDVGDYNSYSMGIRDNKLASLRVPRGYEVELYQLPSFQGWPMVVTADMRCLPSGWLNATSSIRIRRSNEGWGNDYYDKGVTIYSACQYTGHKKVVEVGEYRSLRYMIGNDAISSLRIPAGLAVILYKDENFRGTSTGKITSDNQCLSSYWNNTASSMKVVYADDWGGGNGGGNWGNNQGVVVYSGCNYGGQYRLLTPGNYSYLTNSYGYLQPSSLRIPAGYAIELFEQEEFRGTSTGVIRSNNECLGSWIRGRARSAKVYRDGGPGGGGGGGSTGGSVRFYSSCNYGGSSRTLSPGNYSSLSGSVLPASLQIPRGMVVELFTESGFRGNSTGKITASNACLGDWIRGRARSARVYADNGSGGDNGMPPKDPNGIRVFTGSNYSGSGKYYKEGRYGWLGSMDNRVNSIQVPPGYKVTIFEYNEYRGRSAVIYNNASTLSSYNMTGKVSSMIVEYEVGGGIQPRSN